MIRTEHSVGEATGKMKEGAKDLKDAVVEQVKGQWDHYVDEGTAMIREKPYASLGVAFGLGALVGLLLFRR